ncbi:MAG: hypothetical protein GF401_01310 [Chitinivibrionales bacterium]|nr:hypothetical protein [Chitinivibrionales bacterium]
MKKISPGVVVFIWFFLSLMIFYSGHLYSDDTLAKVESARSLIRKGTFAIDKESGAWGLPGRGGKIYPQYSLGAVLNCLVPAATYEIFNLLSGGRLPRFVLSALITLQNVFFTAGIGVIVFMILVRFGTEIRQAFLYANIMVFCTQILPYSSTGWSEPAALFWSMAGFYALVYKNGIKQKIVPSARWSIWALCAGMASLIRIEYILFFAIFLIVDLLKNRTGWKAHLQAFFILGGIFCFHFAFNYIRFESAFNFGYLAPSAAKAAESSIISKGVSTGNEITSLFINSRRLNDYYHFFISFGKNHWFWVAPLLALSPLVFFFRKEVPERILGAFYAAFLYLPFIKLNTWCWGHRYFYVIFPFLLLPLFFIVGSRTKVFRFSFYILALCGGIIAFFASAVNYHVVLEILVEKYGVTPALWHKTATFTGAPFWYHVKIFFVQAPNTISLLLDPPSHISWGYCRQHCLDIWPVGLMAVGIPPLLSFSLYLSMMGSAAFAGIKLCRDKPFKTKRE